MNLKKRLTVDPYVGIWYGIASENVGGGNTTTVIKPDGTGLTYAMFDNGTVYILEMTWVKDGEGSYSITLSDGSKATVTLDDSRMNMTTSDGFTLTKDIRAEWDLLSMATGAWHNADAKVSVCFNGDGTGLIKQDDKAVAFTWKLKETGVFETTLVDDIAPDGSKTAQWVYDGNSNTFTSGDGTVFSRPTESVDGLITFAG